MPETTNPVEAIFLAALEKPEEERAEFLLQQCGDDQELLRHVTELLTSHEETGSFLIDRQPAWRDQKAVEQDSKLIGHNIGPYTIREKIGEGGMGTVYVAEQERPIRRKVAVKVIKPGMDCKAVLARFEAEQQALAIMNHPNIAKVLDAGLEESGRPYFVMELVSGIPITEYCDEKQLSIEERLQLFIQVCRAIQHAHQKGIIHRDIKPSNVLVTEVDGQAIPKVIDFGVAKALSNKLTDRTLYTNFQAFLGTPLYASPEQASLSNVDVDTRSDVYSLGVLLYELVTGSTPFKKEQLQKAAYDEMCRIIREQQPQKPSTRISTLGAAATDVSTRRRSEPNRLAHMVRGDLDWIVMKALEKDRSRRYDGANGLACDVQRLLNKEAIEARPPSILYLFSRWYRRNRVAALASFMVLAALFVGLAAASIAYYEKGQILAKHQSQTIEVALANAFTGNREAFAQSLAIAEEAGVEADWIATLRGAMAFHDGENNKAIQFFGLALEENDSNTAAWALKAVALVDEGDFNTWSDYILDFDKYKSREKYKQIDDLCLAYASYHRDVGDAVVRFKDILEQRPTWNMARIIYAGALAELGEKQEEPELIRQALEEISHAYHITPNNRFAQLVYVFTRNLAVREGVGETQTLLQEAAPVAQQLARKEDYDIGQLVFADFCSRVSEYDGSESSKKREVEAWEKISDLTGNFASRVFAELYRLGRTKEVINASPSDPEAALARAMVLAQNESTKAEAVEIVENYKEGFNSWYMSLKIVELELLLKKPSDAREFCASWIELVTAVPLNGDDEFRRRLAESIANENVESLKTQNALQAFIKQYFLALLAFSNEDMEDAKAHLLYCAEHRSMNVADHWVRAFLAKWDF